MEGFSSSCLPPTYLSGCQLEGSAYGAIKKMWLWLGIPLFGFVVFGSDDDTTAFMNRLDPAEPVPVQGVNVRFWT